MVTTHDLLRETYKQRAAEFNAVGTYPELAGLLSMMPDGSFEVSYAEQEGGILDQIAEVVEHFEIGITEEQQDRRKKMFAGKWAAIRKARLEACAQRLKEANHPF